MDNIRMAHENARKGKAHYREVRMVDADPDKYLGRIQTMLKDKTFKNSNYRVFVKKGLRKDRVIHKLPYFPDRIIHHCIVQVMEPISVVSAVMSYYGWMKHANCLNLWHRHIDNTITVILAEACRQAGIANPLERRIA